jgi:hypothetical protein
MGRDEGTSLEPVQLGILIPLAALHPIKSGFVSLVRTLQYLPIHYDNQINPGKVLQLKIGDETCRIKKGYSSIA